MKCFSFVVYYHLPEITCDKMRIGYNKSEWIVAFGCFWLMLKPACDCIASGCSPLMNKQTDKREGEKYEKNMSLGIINIKNVW